MNKKKVKELMEQIDFIAHDFIDGDKQEELQNLVSEVQEELSKSDWVSVEDGLPKYGEEVIVCCTKFPDIVYVTYREDRGNYSENEFAPIMDDNSFILNTSTLLGKVTHWKPIEKLEE